MNTIQTTDTFPSTTPDKVSSPIYRKSIPIRDLEHVTSNIESSMIGWKGARILITGATGFFGQWLVESFHHANQTLNLGARLVGIGGPNDKFDDICPQILEMNDVKLINADICDLDSSIDTLLPDWHDRIDAIIHAAIYVDGETYNQKPIPTLSTGVKGTWEVLEIAKRKNVKRFLYVSSGAVYGTQSRMLERIGEDHSTSLDCASAQSAYAESKRFGETLCCGYMQQHGIPVTIARPFAFVGPHLPIDKHFAIGNFIRDVLANTPIVIQSDGSPIRSYLYAADLAIWLWTILSNGVLGRPYNVGGTQTFSLLEIATLIEKASMNKNPIQVNGEKVVGPPNRYVPDTTRAERELGLKPIISLEDAIHRTLEWHRKTI